MLENPEFKVSNGGMLAEKSAESFKEKLQKATMLGAVVFTALAGEACSKDNRNDAEQVGGPDKQIEAQKGYMSVDRALLAEYRHNIHTGNFPAEGQDKRIVARALEIIILKGGSVNKGSTIETKAYRTVPVEIKVDGQFIPVGPDDYTAEELRLVRMVVGTPESRESVVGRTSDQKDGEKISPMAEKIFKDKVERSSSGSRKKIYIPPDFKDF
ncbi:MAG: hypothetical protein EXS46_01440 [Candidatus Taylorbacteria bacterium]|nr:hypothetical protein [Candidatus Taylorbacteria bacterium]